MTLIYFIIMLGLIITIHECGHFIAAKSFHVYIPEFSIGMGPKLFQKQKGETKYTLRLLPIGGYVAMAGEEGVEDFKDIPHERTIKGIHPLKQLVVMLAGVFMNMILALLIFFVVFSVMGKSVATTKLNDVIVSSPAYNAGVEAGDTIVKVKYDNDIYQTFDTFDEYSEIMSSTSIEEPVTFVLEKPNGSTYEVTIERAIFGDNTSPMFGFSFDVHRENISPFEVIAVSFSTLFQTMTLLYQALAQLVKGIGVENLSGPIGMYQITDQMVKSSFIDYLYLIAMISINVGVMNLIPLPMLDGGQAVITIGEMICRKKLNQNVRAALMFGSMVILFAIMVFALYLDVSRLGIH